MWDALVLLVQPRLPTQLVTTGPESPKSQRYWTIPVMPFVDELLSRLVPSSVLVLPLKLTVVPGVTGLEGENVKAALGAASARTVTKVWLGWPLAMVTPSGSLAPPVAPRLSATLRVTLNLLGIAWIASGQRRVQTLE